VAVATAAADVLPDDELALPDELAELEHAASATAARATALVAAIFLICIEYLSKG
jgi:hypothetical protein